MYRSELGNFCQSLTFSFVHIALTLVCCPRNFIITSRKWCSVLFFHDNASQRSIFSLLLHSDLWNQLFSDFRGTWFLRTSFNLEVLFVIEMGLPSADVEKLLSSSLDDEVIVDHCHGHLCELMLSTNPA